VTNLDLSVGEMYVVVVKQPDLRILAACQARLKDSIASILRHAARQG
jgi:hypothetical protein